MGQALVFGALGSSALVIGGTLGAYWRVPYRVSGVLLAFASDTLMTEAFEHGRPLNSMATAAGFLLSFVLSG